MQFEKEYYTNFQYSQRARLIRRHVMGVLRWGSRFSYSNLLNGHGKTALDVGCAYGYAVDVLKSLGYDSYGVDISRYSIKQAKKRIPTADFSLGDVQAGLPFNNRFFDLVTCFEVLEHLSNPLKAIKNMYGSCRDTVICTTPNKVVEKPIKKILRDFDKTHINVKTPQEWEKCLHENLKCSAVKVEPFFDANLRVRDKLLFFKSVKIPYFGLDIRILIKSQ